MGSFKGIAKTRYVNDKQITDHYAIIPTGQGMGNLRGLSSLSEKVYQVICRRFLSIFYPAAIYQKYALELTCGQEHFFTGFRVLTEQGYLKVAEVPKRKKADDTAASGGQVADGETDDKDESEINKKDMENPAFIAMLLP